jgi:pyruvate/2-oxoacid:ferredoxin oxidoreductase alpha subunit/NAD-dependent dihydropyrimidine dehydrogenase PreA subunit
MAQLKERPKPFLLPDYCKGCGRCISACVKDCISFGTEIDASTGYVPVVLDLENCTACGMCMEACPEPYGLRETPSKTDFELQDPAKLFGEKKAIPTPEEIPAVRIPLPPTEPLVIKGNYASAIGALMAGCRHVFGYPITPSTEGAELMAKLMPKLDGVFLQAVSEVATVNHMYGAGGAGFPCMTFTSSPGFSLMLEGISYMVGAEIPGVFVNVMRGGPGLGNIAPEQADVKLVCRGLGHGNTHAIALAPSTPQEMLDLTMLAFELTFKYRNPVIILGDGYLGQMTGKVRLPEAMIKPAVPTWAVNGTPDHRGNLINSIVLSEQDLEAHNVYINGKYQKMAENESRCETFLAEDAEILVVACNTPARTCKGSVQDLRDQGVKAGLFRPITVWPFPVQQLKKVLPHVKHLVVVEASNGQLEDEIRLALSNAGVTSLPSVTSVRHFGGVLPQQSEVTAHIKALVAKEAR